MYMKRLVLGALLCLSIYSLISCAAQQEEPALPDTQRADTATWQYRPEQAETVTIPTPRQHADPEREYFVLQSDSTRITQDGASFWLTVRGPLANGCQRHEYFDSIRQGTTLYLTFWGSRPTDSTVVCTEQSQGYDREIRIENSPYTKFSIVQPDGRTRDYALSSAQLSAK
jgi:hypothetical protein